MTEFEAATIAFQQATLALQQWQVWGAVAIPTVAGLVGAGQCALIWMGLRRMDQANRARLAEAEAREKREDTREKREDARHAEAMARDEARHTEAMEALRQRHAETMRALEGLIKGMETVIERTGGRA